MVVGTLRFVLQIPASASLKAKRQVVRKVIDRIRARFNVSVAEVADNDLWQKATIGVAAVGNDRSFVNEVLDKVLHAVDMSGAECQVVSSELELTSYSDMYGGGNGLLPERTLAEAEGLDEGELPSLEELEAAARRRR
jgi:hypothetical protein